MAIQAVKLTRAEAIDHALDNSVMALREPIAQMIRHGFQNGAAWVDMEHTPLIRAANDLLQEAKRHPDEWSRVHPLVLPALAEALRGLAALED
jgi:hypothetical protein